MSVPGDKKLSVVLAKAPSDAKADSFTFQEILDLTARKRVDYEHGQLVQRLDKDIAESKKECSRLRSIEIQFARLDEKRKGDRWKDTLATLLMAIGGAIVGGAIGAIVDKPSAHQV